MTTPADLPDPRRRVVMLLQAFSAAAQRYAEAAGAQRGLHRSDLHALLAVMQATMAGRATSPGELARAVGLTPSATTTVIDRLVASGHAEREPDPLDRRRTIVRPTESARTDGREMFRPLGDAMSVVVDDLDDAELEVVTRFLHRAIQATTEAAEAAQG
ncbi:MarR family winged helix-turn-helix transcriptional regulator [Aeromicrobium massiliense]|uniref:MarR family winged helix-turn-helix transcriptional regulator n=1 Tax=Aeromicrobium massiliense TaxID=1464554 RepID=UPI0003084C7D|nr:MarR family transcriptional regulator [Aeromicrobium massiliense]